MNAWAQLVAVAAALSDRGMLVTQLHCPGDHPSEWAHGDHGAHVFATNGAPMVVTTDGCAWGMDGAEITSMEGSANV